MTEELIREIRKWLCETYRWDNGGSADPTHVCRYKDHLNNRELKIGVCEMCEQIDEAIEKTTKTDKIKIARQCLKFKGFGCDNLGCKNKSCPLNIEHKPRERGFSGFNTG